MIADLRTQFGPPNRSAGTPWQVCILLVWVMCCSTARATDEDFTTGVTDAQLLKALGQLNRTDADVYQSIAVLEEVQATGLQRQRAWLNVLSHSSPFAQQKALHHLSSATNIRREDVPSILSFLRNPRATTESLRQAALVVSRMPLDDRGHADEVVQLIADRSLPPVLRASLIECLVRSDHTNGHLQGLLEEICSESETQPAFAAFQALSHSQAAETLPSMDAGEEVREARLLSCRYGLFRHVQEDVGSEFTTRWVAPLVAVATNPSCRGFRRAAAVETLEVRARNDVRTVGCMLELLAANDAYLQQRAMEQLRHLDPASRPALMLCLERLAELDDEAIHVVLSKVRQSAENGRFALPWLEQYLRQSTASTGDYVIADVLTTIRGMGNSARSAGETLAALLAHESPLFGSRDKRDIVRLRAWLILTLADIGFPRSALPHLLEALVHAEYRVNPLYFAASIRAVGSLGPAGRPFVPYVLQALNYRICVVEISLERYEPVHADGQMTTARLEAIRTLGRIASPEDSDVLLTLGEYGRAPDGESLPDRAARTALAQIRSRTEAVDRTADDTLESATGP